MIGVSVTGVIVLSLATVALADTALRLRANIPFAFHAGSKLMPAGEYTFEIGSASVTHQSGSAVLIHNKTGNISVWLLTMPGHGLLGTEGRLLFTRYGEEYFLNRVEGSGFQARLTTTKAEREMRAGDERRLERTYISANK